MQPCLLPSASALCPQREENVCCKPPPPFSTGPRRLCSAQPARHVPSQERAHQAPEAEVSVQQVDARTTICDARPPCDDILHCPWLVAALGAFRAEPAAASAAPGRVREARPLLRGCRAPRSGRAARGARLHAVHALFYHAQCPSHRPQVRCCTDVKLSPAWSSPRSGCSVWGASNAGWPCAREKTFAEAEAICQAAGARLCTAAELADGCTAGTGCQFDFELVWGVPPPPIATTTSLLTKDDAGAQVDFTAILIGGAAAAVALLALLVLASRCVPSAPRARCVSQPAFSDWPAAPTAHRPNN